jgi:hypothetical protein
LKPPAAWQEILVTQLDSEVDDLIAACHGDTRGLVGALIMVNHQLEAELADIKAQLVAARAADAPKLIAVLH